MKLAEAYKDKPQSSWFKKGHIPWNKGIKGVLKPNEGSFRKGQIPWNEGKQGYSIKGWCWSIQARMRLSKDRKGRIPWNKGKQGLQTPWNKGKTALDDSRIISAEQHYNWQGGIVPLTELIRKSVIYKLWRQAIFHKDNWTCQECGKRAGHIEAHHLKPFSQLLEENNIISLGQALRTEELWDINNGITLCKACHKKRARKKEVTKN